MYELNIDGLVGPTHHYAGLAFGNTASMAHANQSANPQKAALQGLRKMKFLHDLGFKQAVMPPHPRPNLNFLSQLGFNGVHDNGLTDVQHQYPKALSAAYSASNMWTANAATVTPSIDAPDGKLHFTAANLAMHLHRHQEATVTAQLLKHIFANPQYFTHHQPLPNTAWLNDEGAANHNRFAHSHGKPGLHVFVYGKQEGVTPTTLRYPARQSLQASQAVARKHGLNPHQVCFLQQSAKAIDAGVFHNDVISLANEQVFLVHEDAFEDQINCIDQLASQLKSNLDLNLHLIEVPRNSVSLEDAVKSYLFNAQLLTVPNAQKMMLLAPKECETTPKVRSYIEALLADPNEPIKTVHYMDVKQSMKNGGGPACLRLRVPISKEELAHMHQGVLMTDELYDTLEHIVKTQYRTELSFDDLIQADFAKEVHNIYAAIYAALNLEMVMPK